jgi:Protein of unknown function (DUF998)
MEAFDPGTEDGRRLGRLTRSKWRHWPRGPESQQSRTNHIVQNGKRRRASHPGQHPSRVVAMTRAAMSALWRTFTGSRFRYAGLRSLRCVPRALLEVSMASVNAGRRRSVALRRAGLAGMLMYPIFALTVVVLTWLEWEFLRGLGWTVRESGEVNYPSSLARGDYGIVQVLNFVLLGALGLVFLLGLRTQFVRRRSGMVATVALGMFALAGLFNAMPTDLPGEPQSWHGVLHGIGFLMTMLGALVGFVAVGLALRGAGEWDGYTTYSILTTPLAIVIGFGLAFLGQYSFYLMLTIMLIWFGVMGFRMWRLSTSAQV